MHGILHTGRLRSVRRWALVLLVSLVLPLTATGLNQAQAGTDSVYKPIVPDSPPTSDVSGVVTDESGQPVGGVMVTALLGAERAGPRRTAQTDAAGGFSFADLKPNGYWFLSVNDPHYGWEWDHERWVEVPAKPEKLPVEISLYQARTLRGTVLDEDGKPVAGARVVLVNQLLPKSSQPVSGHIDIDFLVAQTDASSRFTMERLRPGRADLVLEHPDYADTLVSTNVDGKEPTLTIQKGLTLRGRVVHDGQPVAGVEVDVGMNEAHRPIVRWQGKTDSDGRFEAARIRSVLAEYRAESPSVSASMRGRTWYSDYYEVYQSSDRELPPITIEAKPRVGDKAPQPDSIDVDKPAEHGHAGGVGSVNIRLPGSLSNDTVLLESLAISDASLLVSGQKPGVFDNVPAGRYIASFAGRRALVPKTIEVTAGKTVNVSLEPGSSQLKGVIRSGGKAVDGGYVSWFVSPPIPRAVFQGGVQVQADGSYVIEGLTEDNYQLIYEAKNSMPSEFATNVGKESTTLDIDLSTGRIEGALVGRTQKPKSLAGIPSIQVWPEGFPSKFSPHVGFSIDPDRDGRFVIEHVTPGRYTIVGYGLSTVVSVDRPDQVVSASLRPPDKTGEIAGTISHLPPSSGPMDRTVYVTAFPKDEQGYNARIWNYQAECDPKSGAYLIKDIPVGTYGILVSGHAWLPNIEVREGVSRELPIDIPASRPVSVITDDRLSLDRTTPTCRGWRLRMPSGDWLDQNAFAGTLSLPLGEYTIEADYGQRGIVSQKFTVQQGDGTQTVTVNGPK